MIETDKVLLNDIDVELLIRSGKTKPSNLESLQKAVEALLVRELGDKMEVLHKEYNSKYLGGNRIVISLSSKYRKSQF